MLRVVLILGIWVVGSVTLAAVDQKTTEFVVCRSNKAVRSIRITPFEGTAGCKITYTKGGIDDVVGSSRFANGCQSVMDNIRKNLEASNWKCKSTKQGQVLFGTETLSEAQ